MGLLLKCIVWHYVVASLGAKWIFFWEELLMLEEYRHQFYMISKEQHEKEASEWKKEKRRLLSTIKTYEEDAVKLSKRFKLLQHTLQEQQKVLEMYQQELIEKQDSYSLASSKNNDTRLLKKDAETEQKENHPSNILTPRSSSNDIPLLSKASISSSSSSSSAGTRSDFSECLSPELVDMSFHARKLKKNTISASKKANNTIQTKNKAQEESEGGWMQKPERLHEMKKQSSLENVIESKPPKPIAQPKTWAEIKSSMKTTGPKLFQKTQSPRRTKSQESRTENNKENVSYPYIEVVRNRSERKSLPGYDCDECRRYYEALDGAIPDLDINSQMNRCSRHRARFQPYNTPDDFWCLSFPDSEPDVESQ